MTCDAELIMQLTRLADADVQSSNDNSNVIMLVNLDEWQATIKMIS